MASFKQAVRILIKKLQFNPVPLGGDSIFTTTLGIIIGAIVMIIVMVYAAGKFLVIEDSPNVVTNSYIYQNDPYQIDLQSWDLRMSIYENISRQYVNPSNMLQMGLNITTWNVFGEQLQKKNPSSMISHQSDPQKFLTIDNQKTPFNVSGSNYVHESPTIKQYLIEVQLCDPLKDSRCDDGSNKYYSFTLFLKPKWAYLDNPKQSAIKQMNFNQKIKINKYKDILKYQYTYDISGFNVSSDTSLLPSFIPRTLTVQNGSSLAGPAIKIFLPQESKNIIQFHFRRSELSHYYTRKFNSIDVIFAEILGVVALFGLILWFLFAHYNSWASQQFILKSVEANDKRINIFQYLKFYLTCKKRSKKQQTILKQVHQNIIQSYKQRKRRKIQIQILKLRAQRIEKQLKLTNNQQQCKNQMLLKLQQEQRQQMFRSSILTQQIRVSLLKK